MDKWRRSEMRRYIFEVVHPDGKIYVEGRAA